MEPVYRYILKIYEKGSFSKAAEELFLTQPALSMAIQRVENDLGMPLFDRSKRPIEPTQTGLAFIEMARQMEALEQDMKNRIQDLRELRGGTLRLGGSHYLNAVILPEALTEFRRLYPAVRLELTEDSAARLEGMLTARRLDLTFICSEALPEGLERYPAFYDNILLSVPASDPINAKLTHAALSAEDVMAGKHLADACPAVTVEDLAALELILLKSGNDLYDRSVAIFAREGLTPRVALQVDQLATAYHLSAAGFAAALISDRQITAPEPKLRFYKLDAPEARRLFYAILPDRRYTSRAVKEFIRILLQTLS